MGNVGDKTVARRRALRAAQVATISLALGMGACASDVGSEASDEELLSRPRICPVASAAVALSADGESTAVYACACPPYQHWDRTSTQCVCDWTNQPPHEDFGCAVPGPFVPPAMV